MQGSSAPQRSQLDGEIEEFRTKVREQMRHAEAQQQQREKASVFGSGFGRWYLPDTRLLTKESLSLADLPDVPEALTSDGVNKRIEESVLHIMKNPKKYLKSYQNLKSIFGLFDEITNLIVNRDSWKLVALETTYGILLPLHYYLLVRTQRSMLVTQSYRDFSVYVTCSLVVFALICLVKYLINKVEKKIQLLSRQALLHLVHNQLIICDVYFLQNADNNVMHKLLYSEFEDFVEYPRNLVGGSSLLMITIFTWAFRSSQFSLSDCVLSTVLLFLIMVTAIMEVLKQKHYARYMMTNFEQRKNLYEFIKNFKSLTLRNLKRRFEGISTLLMGIKNKAIFWVRFFDTMEIFSVEVCRAGIILLILSFRKTEEEYKMSLIEMASQVIFFYEVVHPIQRFTQGIRRLVHYRSARLVLNRFFDSDLQKPLSTSASSAQSSSAATYEEIPFGGLLLQNMSILDRDNKDIARVIHDLLSRKREKEFKTKSEQLKRAQTISSSTRQNLPPLAKKAEPANGVPVVNKIFDLKGSLMSPNSDSNNLTSIIGIKLPLKLGQEINSSLNQEASALNAGGNTSSPVLLGFPPRSVSSPPIAESGSPPSDGMRAKPLNLGQQPTKAELGSFQMAAMRHEAGLVNSTSKLVPKFLEGPEQESRVFLRPYNNSLQDLGAGPSSSAAGGSFKDLRSLLQPVPPVSRSDSSRSLLRKTSVLDGLFRAFRRQQSAADPGTAYRLKLLIAGLNLKVAPGTRTCVVDKGTYKLSQCLMNCIIGESHNLDGGLRIVRGRISIYSPDRGSFLAGRTIRDNVIFGEDYNPDRYNEVIRFLGLQLASYSGQDLYQISEGGFNMKSEDLRLILLARFLYRDSQIYLIEAHSGRFGKALTFPQIKALLHRLRDRTIIYTSGSPDAARLSDQVLLFGRDGKSRCFSTSRYLNSVARVSMNASMQDSCSQQLDGSLPTAAVRPVFSGSVASAVFMEHLQHTEELKIHQQRQERRQTIQNMIDNRTNVVELISYGMYLTYKRREEGITLTDTPDMKLNDFLTLIKKIYWGSRRALLIALFTSIIPVAVITTGEAFIFYPWSMVDNQMVSSRLTIPLILILFGLLLRYLRIHLFMIRFERISIDVNKEILACILSTSIEQVTSQRSHRLLDKVNKDLIATELRFHNTYFKITAKFLDVLFATGVLTYTYGGFGPIIVVSIMIFLNFRLYKLFLPVYLKIWSMMSWMDYRQDDLNFQMLDLIAAYRPMNYLHKLTHSVKVTSDSMMKVKFTLSKLQKYTDKMIIPINLLGAALLLFMQIFGFSSVETGGFVIKDRQGLAWASIMIFQVLLAGLSLREQFTEIIDLSLHLFRLVEFKERSRANRRERLGLTRSQISGYSPTQEIRLVREMEIRQNSPNSGINYEAPIIFKHVSYTQGQTPVLRRISLTIDPGERMGILGLPGSGRSLLFELVTGVIRRDANQTGKIEVFGVPIEEISEEAIKDNFFLLEQNPVLIEGSVRDNIDPYGQFSDEIIEYLLVELQVQTVLKRETFGTNANIDLTSYFTNRASIFHPSGDISGRPRQRIQSISPLQDLAEVYTPSREKKFIAEPTTPVSVSPSFLAAEYQPISPETPNRTPLKYSMLKLSMQTAPIGSAADLPSETRNARVVIQKMETFHDDEEPNGTVSKKRITTRTEELGNSSMRQAVMASLKDLAGLSPVEIMITKPEGPAESPLDQELSYNHESVGSNKTIKKGSSIKRGVFLLKAGTPSENKRTFDFDHQSHKDPASRAESERGISLGVSPDYEANYKDSIHDFRHSLPVDNMDSMATPNRKIMVPSETLHIRPEPFQPLPKKHSEDLSSMVDHPEKFSAINPSDLDNNDPKQHSTRFLQIPQPPGRDTAQLSEDHFPKLIWKTNQPSDQPAQPVFSSPEADARKLLSVTASFEGRNLDVFCKRLIVFCRAILSAPRVLLIHEGALDFGKGVRWNLQKLEAKLPSSTLVCIVNSINIVPLFEKLALLDAGKILEVGSKDQLLGRLTSFTYRFLKHIDPDGLRQLVNRKNLNNSTMTHTILLEDDSHEEESLDNDKVIEDHDQNKDDDRKDRRPEPALRLLPVEELEQGMSLSSRSMKPSASPGSVIDIDFLPLPSLPAAADELTKPSDDLSKRKLITKQYQSHLMPSVGMVRGLPKPNSTYGMAKTNKFKSKE